MESDSEIMRESIFEILENQIRGNDPPITKETYDRLMADGRSHEDTMKLIGCALSVELFEIMKNKTPFDLERYTANLKGLPDLPWKE